MLSSSNDSSLDTIPLIANVEQEIIHHNLFFLGTSEHTTKNNTLLTEFHNRLGQGNHSSTIIQGIGSGESFKDMVNQLTGYGLEDTILEAYNQIDRLSAKYPGQKIKLNLVGFSRGALATLRLAARLKYTHPNISLNIFAIEPVAGTGNTKDWDANIIPENIDQLNILYQTDEERPGFEPQLLSQFRFENPLKTKLSIHKFPGIHEAATRAINPRSSEQGSYHLSGPAEVTAHYLADFLKINNDSLTQFPIYQEFDQNESENFDITDLNNSNKRLQKFNDILKLDKETQDFKPKAFRFLEKGPQLTTRTALKKECSHYVRDSNVFLNQQHRDTFKESNEDIFNFYFRENGGEDKDNRDKYSKIHQIIEFMTDNDICYPVLKSLSDEIKKYLIEAEDIELNEINVYKLEQALVNPLIPTAKAIAIAIILKNKELDSELNRVGDKELTYLLSPLGIIVPPLKYLERKCSSTPYSHLYIEPKGEIISVDKTIRELIKALRVHKNKYSYKTDFLTDSIHRLKELLPKEDNKEKRKKLQVIIDDTMRAAIRVPTFKGKRRIENTIQNIISKNSTSDEKITKLLKSAGVGILRIKYYAHASVSEGFDQNDIEIAQYKLKIIRSPLFQQFVTKSFKDNMVKGQCQHYIKTIMAAESKDDINNIVNKKEYSSFKSKMRECLDRVNESITDKHVSEHKANIAMNDGIQDADLLQEFIAFIKSKNKYIQSVNIGSLVSHHLYKNIYFAKDVAINIHQDYQDHAVTLPGEIEFKVNVNGAITTEDYRINHLELFNTSEKQDEEMVDVFKNAVAKKYKNVQPQTLTPLQNAKMQCRAGAIKRHKEIYMKRFLEDLTNAPYKSANTYIDEKTNLTELLRSINQVNQYLKERAEKTRIATSWLGINSGKDYYARRDSWIKVLAKISETINAPFDTSQKRKKNIADLKEFINNEAKKFGNGTYHNCLNNLNNRITGHIGSDSRFNKKIFLYQQLHKNANFCRQHVKECLENLSFFTFSTRRKYTYNLSVYNELYQSLDHDDQDFFTKPQDEFETEMRNSRTIFTI